MSRFRTGRKVSGNNVTPDQQIEGLLRQLPKNDKHRVVDFLRGLASKPVAGPTKRKRGGNRTSVADRSFGMIPADGVIVRNVLSEDLYDFE